MKPFVTLIRREFWEHRGLWMAPLIAAAFLLLSVGLSHFSESGFKINVDGKEFAFAGTVTPEQQAKMFGVFIAVLGLPILFTMVVVVFFYLADALYSERKDRSILFWKSLPVSDASTVWSKVATALAVVPLYVWLVAMVTVTLGFLIGSIRVSGTPIGNLAAWDTGIWLRVQGAALVNMLVASLWYAPIAGYMLAVSAWARRSVLMWIILPPVLLTFLEQIVFNSNRIAAFLGRRLAGFFEVLGRDGPQMRRGVNSSGERIDQITRQLDAITATELLGSAELWLGVVVAIALVFVAIRMRRYRDDT
jgi:ABC-2 type transport system permease protein